MNRNNLKNYVIYIVLAGILFINASCSNWERDISNVAVKTAEISTENELEAVVIFTDFPKNISALFFGNGDAILAGTSDGYFYKSIDKGKTWIKTGEMNDKAKINFITTENLSSLTQDVLAGTDKGGYYSSDFGTTWKEILSAKTQSGVYRVLTYGAVQGKVLIFWGNDGEYNLFYGMTTNLTNWQFQNYEVPISHSLLVGSFSDYSSYSLRGYNNNNQSAVYGTYNKITTLFDKCLDITFTMTLRSSSGIYKYLLGTNNGFLESTDYGKTWNQSSLQGQKINCALSYNSGSVLFAGTNDGLYMSIDYGDNWSIIEPDRISDGVRFMFQNKTSIYLITGSGSTCYFRIPSDINTNMFIPAPFLPADNESLESSPFLQWTRSSDSIKVEYRLQIANDASFNNIVVDTTTRSISYKTTLNKIQSKYFWRLKSQNMFYESNWSEVYSFSF